MRALVFSAAFALFLHAPLAGAKVKFVTEILHPESLRGLAVHVKRPLNTRKKIPAVILFGGFETGAQAIQMFDPEVPVAMLTFEYPYTPPRKLTFPASLKHLPEAKQAIHTTIEGIENLVQWVRSQEHYDAQKIVLVGASFGAPFVSIAAGNKPEVRALILAHGFANVPHVVSTRLAQALEQQYGLAGNYLGQLVGRLLCWYGEIPSVEAALQKMHKEQSLLVLTAENDDLIPMEGITALHKAVAGSKARWTEKKFPGGHMRPGDDATVMQLLGESLAWLRLEGIVE